jgi:hypothetical protein
MQDETCLAQRIVHADRRDEKKERVNPLFFADPQALNKSALG